MDQNMIDRTLEWQPSMVSRPPILIYSIIYTEL